MPYRQGGEEWVCALETFGGRIRFTRCSRISMPRRLRRRSRTCARRRRRASNAIGRRNSSGIWTAPIIIFWPNASNSLYSIRLLLKVGGGDPTHGPVGGIHWHMNVANKIEYIAGDESRQKIPWVRVTDRQGVVTEYRTSKFTNDVAGAAIRRMDCMDCHNRPAHKLNSPESAVNMAMALGETSITTCPGSRPTPSAFCAGITRRTPTRGSKSPRDWRSVIRTIQG